MKERRQRLAGLGLTLAACAFTPGCVMQFEQGNERVTMSAAVIPLIAGGIGIDHVILNEKGEVEAELATSAGANLLVAKLGMKVYGPMRRPIGSYDAEVRGNGEDKQMIMNIYDRNGKLVRTLNKDQEELPTAITFTNSDWVRYYSSTGRSIEPGEIVRYDFNPGGNK